MDTKPVVLIVEDSLTQAKRIAASLSAYGLEIVIAGDGLEGLRVASVRQPALVILDVNLPKLDGYQVCRRLKRDKNTAHIPVIMLTTADSSEAAVQGLEVGADDYIPKDVWATENLVAALRAYLPLHK